MVPSPGHFQTGKKSVFRICSLMPWSTGSCSSRLYDGFIPSLEMGAGIETIKKGYIRGSPLKHSLKKQLHDSRKFFQQVFRSLSYGRARYP